MGPAGVWGRFPRGAGEMSRSDKGGRRACARPEPPPTPGPRRSDRSKNDEALGFKTRSLPGQGAKSWLGEAESFKNNRPAQAGRKAFDLVKPAASNISAPPGQGKNSRLGETETFTLCVCSRARRKGKGAPSCHGERSFPFGKMNKGMG